MDGFNMRDGHFFSEQSLVSLLIVLIEGIFKLVISPPTIDAPRFGKKIAERKNHIDRSPTMPTEFHDFHVKASSLFRVGSRSSGCVRSAPENFGGI
jgi:hypothetical protein